MYICILSGKNGSEIFCFAERPNFSLGEKLHRARAAHNFTDEVNFTARKASNFTPRSETSLFYTLSFKYLATAISISEASLKR